MRKQTRYVTLIIVIPLVLIVSNVTGNMKRNIEPANNTRIILNSKIVGGNHSPININGNGELVTFISDEGLNGDGTIDSPYIIENFIIDATTAHGIAIRFTDAYLVIRNCTVDGGQIHLEEPPWGYYGIHINNTVNVNISHNNVNNNIEGIYLDNSSYNTLSENTANDNGNNGIALYHSNNNTLSGNTASNKYAGISLFSSSYNTLSGNNASYNIVSGIELHSSHNNTLAGNTASNNDWGYGSDMQCDGIGLYYSDNNMISGNNASYNYGDGIGLYTSDNNIISGNNASYNNRHGIYLYYSNYNTLSSNTASYNNEYGICLDEGGRWNTLAENIALISHYYQTPGFQFHLLVALILFSSVFKVKRRIKNEKG
ncbi:MAG: right-handed parallel beta-helix repeat-containing protein [Promethearchaeota archaeon]|jgi:parallel beta-helix repeat protein